MATKIFPLFLLAHENIVAFPPRCSRIEHFLCAITKQPTLPLHCEIYAISRLPLAERDVGHKIPSIENIIFALRGYALNGACSQFLANPTKF